MPAELTNCPAPAKLNLFLHVTGRRADGYHLLETVFQLIDLQDTLHFTDRPDAEIRRVAGNEAVPASEDLIVRAAQLLQKAIFAKSGIMHGADIAIEKKIPSGGGLGGGSSDAATTLMALNQLWKGGLSRAQLMQVGLELGADVPFFIFGNNAFATGVGEKLQPLVLPESAFLVIHPGIAVPTAAIFRSEQLTRNTEMIKILDFPGYFDKNSFFGKNDLQPVAEKLYPPVLQAVTWLGNHAEARMTGSGSCVFARFESEAKAQAVLRHLPSTWQGWVTRGMNTHPLAAILQAADKSGQTGK